MEAVTGIATPQAIDIDRVTRAVDKDGQEWVPASEFRTAQAHWESLRCLIVNPRRNTYRAMRALTEDKDIKRALYFLEHAADGLDAAYEEAFPPRIVNGS